jgi:hypothetical protein
MSRSNSGTKKRKGSVHTIQELKNRQKTMSITERLKGNQDLKKLQADLKAAQMQKQERQVEVEPLQEKAVQMIVQLEEEKRNMVQGAQTESTTLIQEEITMQFSRGTDRKSRAGQDARKGTSREVPNFGNNRRRSAH